MSYKKLTPRQKRFVAELVASRSVRETAEQAVISEATAKRLFKRPAMQRLVGELVNGTMQTLVYRLRQLGHEAADVLAVAINEVDTWGVRMRAADVTLSQLPPQSR